jgi:hypothetical protein
VIARLVQRIVRGDTSRLTTERLVLARFLDRRHSHRAHLQLDA